MTYEATGILEMYPGQTAEIFAGVHGVAVKGNAGTELSGQLLELVVTLGRSAGRTVHHTLHTAFCDAKESLLPVDDTAVKIRTLLD